MKRHISTFQYALFLDDFRSLSMTKKLSNISNIQHCKILRCTEVFSIFNHVINTPLQFHS